jgi:UDP-perosamine 4-acetyltransferase
VDPALRDNGVNDWSGVKVLGGDAEILDFDPSKIFLANAIGSLPGDSANIRIQLFEKFTELGYRFPNLIHPCAVVSPSVSFGEGCQIMAGAVIQAATRISSNVIVNTGASIDHDCHIAKHCHIAPGAVLCGGVMLGKGVHVGSGATIIQAIQIGQEAVVGAGTTVRHDIRSNQTFIGDNDRHTR